MQILYVDDDKSMTRAVGLMLRQAGHSCDTTHLGERAVQLAKTKDYDAIILDIMLPDIDGYEVIERLREGQVSTPLLIQTGLVERTKPGDARAFGTDDVLLKPFDTAELIEHLKRTMARSAEAARQEEAEPAGDAPEGRSVNQRQHERVQAIEPCEITLDGKTSRGMVMNLSEGGAALRLPRHMTNPPETFTLTLAGGHAYTCRVCWRIQGKVGVAFV